MRLRQPCYRLHDPRWAFSPTSGVGAAIHGGRLNRKGRQALYLGLSVEAAMIEGAQGFAGKFKPYTMVSYDLDCADIADLREEEQRKALGIAFDDLACPWFALAGTGAEPPSWRVAEQLIGEGLAGATYPSFAVAADPTRHHNLVLWDWSDALPHQVLVHDPDGRLPRDQSSWR